MPRLSCSLAQRHGRDLDGLAGDGRALVWDHGGIAKHHHDACKRYIELFGDNLAKRGADAGAEIDMAVVGGDRAVGRDFDESLELPHAAGGTNDRESARGRHQSFASTRSLAAR